LVILVRTKLNNQQRTTIGALIVIDVHAKDVTFGMRDANVTDIASFEWIS
jgi:dynein heavy chain